MTEPKSMSCQAGVCGRAGHGWKCSPLVHSVRRPDLPLHCLTSGEVASCILHLVPASMLGVP